jgi:hypothetical protein
MNDKSLRNLLCAVLAVSATAITTQTIVRAAPRPYAASNAPIAQAQPAARAPGALCAGRGEALC